MQDPYNSQPHIEAIEKDEYYQYRISIESHLVLETTEFETALFVLLGSHYVLNLSYHEKAVEFFLFVQEKIAKISSDDKKKKKSSVAVVHVSGLCREYNNLCKEFEDDEETD